MFDPKISGADSYCFIFLSTKVVGLKCLNGSQLAYHPTKHLMMWSQMLFILHPKKWPTWIWCRSSGYLGFPTGDGSNFELPTFQPGLLLWSLVNMVGKCGKNMENTCFFFQRCRKHQIICRIKIAVPRCLLHFTESLKEHRANKFFFRQEMSFNFCTSLPGVLCILLWSLCVYKEFRGISLSLAAAFQIPRAKKTVFKEGTFYRTVVGGGD